MKYPTIWEEKTTLVYFAVTLWPDGGGYGKTLKTVYKTARGAEKRAREEISRGGFSGATIRKEEVFYRNENNEFSSSGVFKNI